MEGIKETKEMLEPVIGLGNNLAKALEDGKFDMGEIVYFMEVLMKLPAAIEGADKIPAEMKDIDASEIEELVDFIKERFDIPQDEIEEKIEAGMEFIKPLSKFVLMFIKK